MRRSASSSKQNFQTNITRSYNDLTSPLTNISALKQKTNLKNSLKNNILLKMQMYQNCSKPLNKSMNIYEIKANSFIYKIPQITTPQINFQVSQAIKKKVDQIKNDMVTHLPQIKSSNYNPKKLQNQFNHRSSILELQEWLKTKLKQNPPITVQQSLEYKNMIMGIGMKQLIRIINKRCLQEGKMIEQVWELTWSICREIILYLSKRSKKCQEVLENQLNFYNSNCKKNFSNIQFQLNQAKNTIKSFEQQNLQLKLKIQQIQEQNNKLMIENSTARVNQGNYHQEFLKILQQNLAIYLQIGDNSKRNWIKKMYLQISKAKNQIRPMMKQQVNTTVMNKIKQEKIVSDEIEQEFQIDQEGNLVMKTNTQEQKEQNQSNQIRLQNHSQLNDMKKKLEEEFKPVNMHSQTDKIEAIQVQTQCPILIQTSQKQMETDFKQTIDASVNTQQLTPKQFKQSTQSKQKKPKESVLINQKKQKIIKGASKQRKGQRKSSIISSNNQQKQIVNAPLSRFITNNSLDCSKIITLTQEGEQSSKVEMIQYICKNCKEQKSCFQVQLQKSDDQTGANLRQKTYNQIKNNFNLENQNKRYFNNQFNGNPNFGQREQRSNQKRVYQHHSYKLSKNDIIPQLDQENQYFTNNFEQYKKNIDFSTQSNPKLITQNRQKQKSNSSSFHSNKGNYENRYRKRRQSTLIHDVSYKKEMDMKEHNSNFKENQIFQGFNENQNFLKVSAKLSLVQKQPYFKFFHDQIVETNKFYLQQIVFPQLNFDYVLDKYFFLVQQINDLPQSKIILNQKQMNAAIQKNLIPIIVQLLGQVKKSIKNQTVQQTIRNFPSLPFTVMNKFSTKYGVKILAIKNMKILLSSLKKIQTYSQKYKLLRLMLFTDCKAYYSEDLFVYLMIISIMDPFIQIDKTINYDEVNQLRSICQTHLTTQKKVYQQFNRLTKEELGKTKTHSTFSQVKLSPLVRSIITNYRMMKINKIQQLGFIFFMLKKENHVDYNVFTFFISCLNMDISVKVKIAKTFLANCDLKLKNNKMAISESGYSKFLIRCPQFTFQYIKQIVKRQMEKLEYSQKSRSISDNICKSSATKTNIQKQQQNLSKTANIKHARVSLPNIQNQINYLIKQDTRLSTQKQILLSSRKSLLKGTESLQVSNEQIQIQRKKQRSNKKKLSLLYRQRNKSEIPIKIRQYSSFTFQIVRFLQSQDDSKLMNGQQKGFLQDYLHIHVLSSQIQQVIGIVDYFSSQMLELICLQKKEMQISEKAKNLLAVD